VALLSRLSARKETLAVAESCTGGGLGAELTSIPGSSEVFLGGLITYSDGLKIQLLGVPASTIAIHGAVSKPCALAMAEGARRVTEADWAVSVTGIAGPSGGSEDKPVGTVWLGIAGPGVLRAEQLRLPGDRHQIRSASVRSALDHLARSLEESNA
jgi:nicotinamide-nucleotide amidase